MDRRLVITLRAFVLFVESIVHVMHYRGQLELTSSVASGETNDTSTVVVIIATTVVCSALLMPVGINQHPLRRILAIGLYFLPFFIPKRFQGRREWRTLVGLFLWVEFLVRPLAKETLADIYLMNGGAERWATCLNENVWNWRW